MVDGVFDDGLEGDLVAVVIQARRVHLEPVGKLILVAILLDLQIALGVFDLLGDGDELVALADADAEEPGQGVDHLHRVGVAALFAHPGDGVQGIVEEMGVDLGLKGPELRFAEIYLLLPDGGHQLLDPQHHVAEGTGELLDLPGTPHGAVGEVVRVGFKALHSVRQAPERPGQQPGQKPAGEYRRPQQKHRQDHGQPDHLTDVAIDQLIHIAHAHHPPVAVRHAGDAVDHRVVGVGVVRQGGQGLCILRLQSRVQQLLLGMVDDIALLIHEKAVAPLADTHVVDIGGDTGKAQVQRYPSGLVPRLQGHGHGHHPGVVLLKNRLHMGRGHIGAAGKAGPLQVKGQILEYLLPGLPVQAPAVQQLSRIGVTGHRHHVGPEQEERGEHPVPVVRVLQHGMLHHGHGLIHALEVVAHGIGHLGYRLSGAGAGALDHGAAVAVEKEDDAAAQDHRHHPHYHGHQNGGDAQACAGDPLHWTSPAFSSPSLRRMVLGDSPQYFLKQ